MNRVLSVNFIIIILISKNAAFSCVDGIDNIIWIEDIFQGLLLSYNT